MRATEMLNREAEKAAAFVASRFSNSVRSKINCIQKLFEFYGCSIGAGA
jgi:hypothetical protein